MSSAYWTQPISDQVTAVDNGAVSVPVLVASVRDQIAAREPELAAWTHLSETAADEATRLSEMAGFLPLRGISVGVKDLIDVAGLPTRAGCAVTPSGPASIDASCVARLRELGAVIQGKTVTTEFGYFAPGPTRNPHAANRTPGGSSSGSAAAVGAGTVPLALGTQTAGSLTRPASYCGAAGMVLAQGSTSLDGVIGLSETLDSLGLLTRTVDDLRYVFRVFTGARQSRDSEVRRALVWDGSGLHDLDPSMNALLAALPDVLGSLGVTTEPLEWDDHVRTLCDDHVTVMSYEAARRLESMYDKHSADLSAPLRSLVEDGRAVTAEARSAALTRRDRSRELFDGILGNDTIVIGPAAPGPAPEGLEATGSPILSRPWQLLGAVVVVVPGARTTSGLPLGIQLIGRLGLEEALLDTGVRLEQAARALPAW